MQSCIKMNHGSRLGLRGCLSRPSSTFLKYQVGCLAPLTMSLHWKRPFGSLSRALSHLSPPSLGSQGLAHNSNTQGVWRSTVKQLRREVKNAQTSQVQKELLQGSQKVVALAILSNGVMFSGKLIAAIQSGSASLFSEALHSLADSKAVT